MNLEGLIFIPVGIINFCGAFFDCDWYMEHRKIRRIANNIGRNGTRVFFSLLGIVLIVFGVLYTIEFIEFQN